MGKNTERVQRANHKTNKRMSIFRYTQVRSYKTVPNDFFVELKRYFVTQGFKIKRFEYTATSGQMVGRKDGWHLNFVPKFVLDIKQVHGVHFITFNYFARVRKIGIASGIATQGITALIGAATITGYLVAARNLVDAVGRAMDALAGNPLSVEWLEKEEAGEETKPEGTTTSSVTYNTTNITNAGPDPNSNTKETNTVVEHHHHYYYGGQNEQTQNMPRTQSPVPMVEEPIIHEVEAPQQQPRLAIMHHEPAQPVYRQSDLEKELISMLERGDSLSTPEYDTPAPNPFMGGANASVYEHDLGHQQGNHNNHQQYGDMPSSHFFTGGAQADVQAAQPAHNPFSYEDNTPAVPQYNLPSQHAPLYSIEPLSYNNKMTDHNNGFRLEELREIAPAMQPQQNPFYTMNAKPQQQQSNDPFADLSLENVAGAYGMKTHHHQEPITTGEHGYARN